MVLLPHELRLKDENTKPVLEPRRRHPLQHLQEIDKQVDVLLKAGLIVPSRNSE